MPLEVIELNAKCLLVFPFRHRCFCKKSCCILTTPPAHSVIKQQRQQIHKIQAFPCLSLYSVDCPLIVSL